MSMEQGIQAEASITNEAAARQMIAAFRDQMEALSRSGAVLFFLLLVPAIPLFYLPASTIIGSTPAANVHASIILLALPVVSMASASAICGDIVLRGFIRAPAASLVGRFLAGLTVPVAVVCGAYGVAFAISTATCPMAYTWEFLVSLGVAVAGTFFFCAFSFMMGIRFGNAVLSFFLLAVVIPAACLSIAYAVPGLAPIMEYSPVFSTDMSLNILGSSGLSFASLVSVALGGRLESFAGSVPAVMSAVSAILGLACVVTGCRWADRRDARCAKRQPCSSFVSRY